MTALRIAALAFATFPLAILACAGARQEAAPPPPPPPPAIHDDAGKSATAGDAAITRAPHDARPSVVNLDDPPKPPPVSIETDAGTGTAAGTNVALTFNTAALRHHKILKRVGPVLDALPQWKAFLSGPTPPVDPIRDLDWVTVSGPSLIHTDKDVVLVGYNVADAAVDPRLAAIARRYDKGGPFDVGIPGVKAWLGYADNAERVFFRASGGVLAIVPRSHAHDAAVGYKKRAPRAPATIEMVQAVVNNPGRQIILPRLSIPASMTQLRFSIAPRGDGAADFSVEGDCADAAAAADAADLLTEYVKRNNTMIVRLATRGLLDNAKAAADGSKVKVHMAASAEQLEALLNLTAALLGAQIAPPAAIPRGN